jgi:uncharacterized membrane protein
LSDLELVLRAVNLFCAALIVGALVIMQHSIVPIMRKWPAQLSLQLHRDIIEVNPDVYIRPCGALSLITAILALVVGDHVPRASVVLTLAGVALLVGVAIVSEALNQPINRRIRDLPDAQPPPDYLQTRERWMNAHLLRTVLGVAGLICYIVGALKAV